MAADYYHVQKIDGQRHFMKVLFVCSGNEGEIKPFIKEQGDSLISEGLNVEYFIIYGKGILGYLKNLRLLKNQIKNFKADLIHAHYGLSGFLSIFQRKIPVIITFHGSDLNIWWVKYLSYLAAQLSAKSIFVSKQLAKKINVNNYDIVPCGVNTDKFISIDKQLARKKLGFESDENIIVFSSSFDNKVKNYPLAKKALELIDMNYHLIELKGYTRDELKILLNASDLVLLTSFTEGSPQIIKEAMACNIPIVSTDVGDVKEVISGMEGCYITSFNPQELAEKIKSLLKDKKRTNGRQNILQLDNKLIAKKINSIYQEVLR